MKSNTKIAIGLIILGILVGAWVDSDNTKELPDYTVSCERPVNGMCQIINSKGDFVFDITSEEARDNELFTHPESIQNWLDRQSTKYN